MYFLIAGSLTQSGKVGKPWAGPPGGSKAAMRKPEAPVVLTRSFPRKREPAFPVSAAAGTSHLELPYSRLKSASLRMSSGSRMRTTVLYQATV